MFIRVDQFKGKRDTINRKKSTDMKCGITWTGKSKLRQRGNPAGEISRRCAVTCCIVPIPDLGLRQNPLNKQPIYRDG